MLGTVKALADIEFISIIFSSTFTTSSRVEVWCIVEVKKHSN